MSVNVRTSKLALRTRGKTEAHTKPFVLLSLLPSFHAYLYPSILSRRYCKGGAGLTWTNEFFLSASSILRNRENPSLAHCRLSPPPPPFSPGHIVNQKRREGAVRRKREKVNRRQSTKKKGEKSGVGERGAHARTEREERGGGARGGKSEKRVREERRGTKKKKIGTGGLGLGERRDQARSG